MQTSSYFLDTSALVKGYSPERGSHRVETLISAGPDHTVILSEIALPETSAALHAKARAPRGLTATERDRALSRFLQDCDEQYQLVAISREVVDLAVELTRRRRLRGCDALHLASALLLNQAFLDANLSPLTFVCADNDLLIAAEEEGIPVENPEILSAAPQEVPNGDAPGN